MDTIWMFILIGLIIAACVVGAIITLRVSKKEERIQEKHRKEGDTAEDELERSHEYEEKSLKSNLPNLIRIYAISIAVALVVYWVLVYFFA